MLGTLPNGSQALPASAINGWRAISVDSQFDDENFSLSDEDNSVDIMSIRRRMSVDEKTLRNAVSVDFLMFSTLFRTMRFSERVTIISKLWELLVS